MITPKPPEKRVTLLRFELTITSPIGWTDEEATEAIRLFEAEYPETGLDLQQFIADRLGDLEMVKPGRSWLSALHVELKT